MKAGSIRYLEYNLTAEEDGLTYTRYIKVLPNHASLPINDLNLDYFEIDDIYLFIPTAKKDLEADDDLIVRLDSYVVNNGTDDKDIEMNFSTSSDQSRYIDTLLPGELFEPTLWLWVPLPEECEEYHDLRIDVEKPKKWSKTLHNAKVSHFNLIC